MTLSPDRYEQQRRELDPESLMKKAAEVADLSDFGDKTFIKPMTHFLDQAAREVDFTADGLEIFKAHNIRFLVNRLRTHEDIQRNPDILAEDVSDPIIIIGLPRSGTTKLQRMMTAAPDVQKLFMWRMLNPARFPGAVPGQPDSRIAASNLGVAMTGGSKEVNAAHAMAADLVDEEFVLFDYAYDSTVSGFSPHIPFFFHEQWPAGVPSREASQNTYRYVRTLLQYLQWQDGGKRNRPWILKAIMHLPHIETLMECFPRATVIHCHRDPRSSIPSMAKIQFSVWSTVAKVEKEFCGKGFLDWGATGMKRYLEIRDRLNLDDRIFDVKYDDIRTGAMPIIRDIYQRGGLDLTKEAEQAMLQWEDDNEQGKHGTHSYSLEEFSLDSIMIDEHFSEYIDRFIDRQELKGCMAK